MYYSRIVDSDIESDRFLTTRYDSTWSNTATGFESLNYHDTLPQLLLFELL